MPSGIPSGCLHLHQSTCAGDMTMFLFDIDIALCICVCAFLCVCVCVLNTQELTRALYVKHPPAPPAKQTPRTPRKGSSSSGGAAAAMESDAARPAPDQRAVGRLSAASAATGGAASASVRCRAVALAHALDSVGPVRVSSDRVVLPAEYLRAALQQCLLLQLNEMVAVAEVSRARKGAHTWMIIVLRDRLPSLLVVQGQSGCVSHLFLRLRPHPLPLSGPGERSRKMHCVLVCPCLAAGASCPITPGAHNDGPAVGGWGAARGVGH